MIWIIFLLFIFTTIFLISNFLIGFNPFSKKLHVIRITSIIVIIFILYYNSIEMEIATTCILPFSIKSISYLHELDSPWGISSEQKIEIFYLFKTKETSDFLNKLDDEENYTAFIEFIPDVLLLESDIPVMVLSKAFLLNKFSSEEIITKFIFERLEEMVEYYFLDDSIIQEVKQGGGPVVILRYAKIYKIY